MASSAQLLPAALVGNRLTGGGGRRTGSSIGPAGEHLVFGARNDRDPGLDDRFGGSEEQRSGEPATGHLGRVMFVAGRVGHGTAVRQDVARLREAFRSELRRVEDRRTKAPPGAVQVADDRIGEPDRVEDPAEADLLSDPTSGDSIADAYAAIKTVVFDVRERNGL